MRSARVSLAAGLVVITGFQARPVVGGVFVKMLSDAAIAKKWSGAAGGK